MKTRTTLTVTLAGLVLLTTASAVEVLPTGYTVKPFASYTCSVSLASIGLPYGMACAPDGNLYVSQWHNYPDSGSLYRISPSGQAVPWLTGFGTPRRMVWAGGSGFGDFLYLTDGTSDSILRVSLSGEVATFAEVSGGLHSLGLEPVMHFGRTTLGA